MRFLRGAVILLSIITHISSTIAYGKTTTGRKLDFTKWEKVSSSKSEGPLRTDIYQRFVTWKNSKYPVGITTHLKIKKESSKKHLDLKQAHSDLVDSMDLSDVKKSTVGSAEVVEGFWKKGRRYYRMYTKETDTHVDIILFNVRKLYVNNVAAEAEVLQRYLTGNLKTKTAANWFQKIWSGLLPEAYAQTVCPPQLSALCNGSGLDGLTSQQRDEAMRDLDNLSESSARMADSIETYNRQTGEQNAILSRGIDVYGQSVQDMATAATNAANTAVEGAENAAAIAARGLTDAATIASQGAKDAATIGADAIDRTTNKILKRGSRSNMTKDAIAVVAAGTLTAAAVTATIALVGFGIDKLLDALSGRKDRAFIANALKEAREQYTSIRNELNNLESQIDSHIEFGFFLKDFDWDVEKALKSLEQDFVETDVRATLAKQELEGNKEAMLKYFEAKKNGKLAECAKDSGKYDLCKELLETEKRVIASVDANIARDSAREKANEVRKLSPKNADKTAFCKNMYETLEAVPEAEQALQYYRQAYLAGQFVNAAEAADYLKAQKNLRKYTTNDRFLKKEEEAYKESERDLKKAESNETKEFGKKCESALNNLSPLKRWQKDPTKVLKETGAITHQDYNGRKLESYGKSATDYNQFVCYYTMQVSFGSVSTPNNKKDWFLKCYNELTTGKGGISEERLCSDLWNTYKTARTNKSGRTARNVTDERRKSVANLPIILQITPPTNTEVVAENVHNHYERMKERANEQRCFGGKTACTDEEKKRVAQQEVWKKDAASICIDSTDNAQREPGSTGTQ